MSDIKQIIDSVGSGRENLIAYLRRIQADDGYLSEKALLELADSTGISASEIISVATFYSEFRTRPSGKHTIGVCIGTACHVKGASEITAAFKKTLGIGEDDDTDADMLFTVDEVACLGCCMLAPAVRIDDVIYGDLTPERVGDTIADFLREKESVSKRSHSKSVSANFAEMRICLCSSCSAAGAAKVADELMEVVEEFSLSATLKEVACTGKSFAAPLMELRLSDGTSFTYGSLTPESARIAVLRHLKPDSILTQFSSAAYSLLDSLLGGEGSISAPIRFLADSVNCRSGSGCSCESEIVTLNAGEITPLNIDEYIATGGFSALHRVVEELSPDKVIEEVSLSGLRGRGGGGFPVADKWSMVKNNNEKIKYLVCNGDEGDPGAFMDRMILESFPFKVIEGIAIAALAIGANEGIIYVRSEYPLAAENARKAISICETRGLLGENAAESGKSLTVRVVEGAGAFVCGEETALIAALEGRRGTPSPRPPYPAERGFRGKPTLVNNVETFASVPWIVSRGSAKFADFGTEKSRGSKTFALAGRIRRGGLVEVPMGTTLNEIVYDIGGGIQNDAKAKAVLVGGPSGACIPERLFDTPIDYERLTELGGMMGSGGLVVLDETDCMVDIARYFLSFTQNESCGKCVFCRVGTKRMLEILEDMCEGRGQKGDVDRLVDLAERVREGSLCGLGGSAPNPVLTAIRYFREEFDAHLAGKCPAGKCKELVRYFITTDCIGCTICAQNCPVDAIKSIPLQRHEIDPEICVRCGGCLKNCPTGSVKVR